MTESGMPVLKLDATGRRCDLCKRPYVELNEWLDHLVGKTHLRRARRQFLEWTSEMTTLSIVIFTDFPVVNGYYGNETEYTQDVAGVVTALQTITDLIGNRMCSIKTFVAWAKNPFVGVVQLDNA